MCKNLVASKCGKNSGLIQGLPYKMKVENTQIAVNKGGIERERQMKGLTLHRYGTYS